MLRLLLCLAPALLAAAPAGAAVFQYRVTIDAGKGPTSAFLWIPPEAEQVRGVVMAGMTLMEREFVQDEKIRRACANRQLALVFVRGGLQSVKAQDVLDAFARKSGYGEIAVAPLMFVGHSAGGPQAKSRAVEMADRCFGLVQYRGGVPGGEKPVPPGLPVLMMIGQFDEFAGTMRDASGREAWEGGRDALRAYRAAHPRHLASIVVEPGAGHFAWSERNAEYLALFIDKAARAMIPAAWPRSAAEPVAVNKIDPADGWLTDLAVKAAAPGDAAPYAEYSGDKSAAAWHFDEELAKATVAYHAGQFDKKDQFIKWNDPYWVDAGARFFFTRVEWIGDGQTFEVHPAYAEVYPSQHNGHGPRWHRAGKPVGNSGEPIRVRPVGGPLVGAGAHRLRLQCDALAPATERPRATFLAYSEGDPQYRYSEQVGMLPRGFRGFTQGEKQAITFPALPDIRADAAPVKLEATSDAGLPVEYYVAGGPAKIVRGRLVVVEVPARAQFPIEVEIVAYQFGRGREPRVQTATPVQQTIRLRRP